jgi:ABC-type Fe3+/spermidine/putrescine transport system ATPase subunit
MDLFPRGAAPPGENALEGTVEDVIYQGEIVRVLVATSGGGSLTVALRNGGQLARPLGWARVDAVLVAWRPDDCRILERDG